MMETTITPANATARGSYCIFVRLDATHGVKFYPSAELRDDAMRLQDNAHAVACGPAVYGTLEMDRLECWSQPATWEDPKRVYGYVTDVVEVCELSYDEYISLIHRLDMHGISTCDLGMGHNTGRTLSGVPVRYDFDRDHA